MIPIGSGRYRGNQAKPLEDTTMETLAPAYGRDFKTAKAAKESFLVMRQDWERTSMFRSGGRYTSCDDWKGQTVILRFDGSRKTTSVKVPR